MGKKQDWVCIYKTVLIWEQLFPS